MVKVVHKGAVKSIDLTNAVQWHHLFGLNGSGEQSYETLAAEVGWVYTALAKRRDTIGQIDCEWVNASGEAIDSPLGISAHELMQRADYAIQIHGRAAYHKEKNRVGRLLRLRWLDPAALDEHALSVGDLGYEWWRYTTVNHAQEMIPLRDLLLVQRAGMREHDPLPSAMRSVSRAAQIVLGGERTEDDFFDAGALPAIVVTAPMGTNKDDVSKIRNSINRLFNRTLRYFGDGAAGVARERVKTAGVTEGVKVDTLSFSPHELKLDETDRRQADKILSAFGVPAALVHKDVNQADSYAKREEFVLTMASQMAFIARNINKDPEVQRAGVTLKCYPERHEALQLAWLRKASAIQMLTGNQAILTIGEARERLNLEVIPELGILPRANPQIGGEAVHFLHSGFQGSYKP